MKQSLRFEYREPPEDVMVIEGIRYSGDLFRSLSEGGLRVGSLFRIKKRDDGLLVIEDVGDPGVEFDKPVVFSPWPSTPLSRVLVEDLLATGVITHEQADRYIEEIVERRR